MVSRSKGESYKVGAVGDEDFCCWFAAETPTNGFVIWSGFIHVELQCTERTLALNQASLANVPIKCLRSLSYPRCRILQRGRLTAPRLLVHASKVDLP